MYNPTKIFVDGANPSVIRSLKLQINEDAEYGKCIQRYKSMKVDYAQNMRIVPINFAQMHKEMLSHTKMLLENGFIAINPRFTKLIVSLRTAVEQDGKLNKQVTSFNDVYDSFRLACHMFQFN